MFGKLFSLVVAALVCGASFAANAITMEEYLRTPKLGELHQAADTAIVHSCERSLSSGNLVDPVRTFANGAIKVGHISTEEPAAAAEHLLIYVRGKNGRDDCFAVSARDEQGYIGGFHTLDFANVTASYNDQTGLLLRIPASVNFNGDEQFVGDVKVRIQSPVRYSRHD